MGDLAASPEDLKDTPLPDWKKRHTPIASSYESIIRNLLSKNASAGTFRQPAYDRIAGNQLGAEDAIKQNATTAYGGLNPSGRTGALIAQQRANAPYGQADITAREASREANLQTGQAGLAANQAVANRYISRLNPYLQNKSIETQAALGLAQLDAMPGAPGAGSSANSWLGPTIGAVGSIAAALILS